MPQMLVIVDVETTGANTKYDQVIELGIQLGLGEDAEQKLWRIKPKIPISPGATAVHGIKDEDLLDCPAFPQVSSEVRELLEGADVIVGYNLSFDLEMLQAEFRRMRAKELHLSAKILIDPLKIWRTAEPRRLSNAVKRFLGTEHADAHTSRGDIAATGKVLEAMIRQFGLDSLSFSELEQWSNPERKTWIGPTPHLQWASGAVVLGFGKFQGCPLERAVKLDSDYLNWILGSDFPDHVKEIIKTASVKSGEEFVKWVGDRYGAPLLK